MEAGRGRQGERGIYIGGRERGRQTEGSGADYRYKGRAREVDREREGGRRERKKDWDI